MDTTPRARIGRPSKPENIRRQTIGVSFDPALIDAMRRSAMATNETLGRFIERLYREHRAAHPVNVYDRILEIARILRERDVSVINAHSAWERPVLKINTEAFGEQFLAIATAAYSTDLRLYLQRNGDDGVRHSYDVTERSVDKIVASIYTPVGDPDLERFAFDIEKARGEVLGRLAQRARTDFGPKSGPRRMS